MRGYTEQIISACRGLRRVCACMSTSLALGEMVGSLIYSALFNIRALGMEYSPAKIFVPSLVLCLKETDGQIMSSLDQLLYMSLTISQSI